MFARLQLVSHRGFDKKMEADVLDLHDSAGCMTCLNLVIMSEKTWIVLLGQSCATKTCREIEKTQPCSNQRPILHLEIYSSCF